MKKAISLLLAIVLCLSLCACGGSKQESNGNGNTSVSVTIPVIYPGTGGDKIALDDLVLAEDDKVKISVVEFYTNKIISAGNSDGGKCITFKIENKTDYEMNVWLKSYLNNETLEVAFVDGNSTVIEAGRVGRIGFSFTYGSYPNWTDLESLEDLYDLEFTFDLKIGFGTANYEEHKVQCSFASAMNGGDNSAVADPEIAPAAEHISIHNDVHFGENMDEVAAKEQRFEIDYESAGEGGYISAQAEGGVYETVTFEGIEDAYLFYYFGAKTEELEQAVVMFFQDGGWSSALDTYEDLLKVYFDRYGVHLSEEQKEYIPIETLAYEYATTHYENTELQKHTRWLLEDAEGYVILDIALTLNQYGSYCNYLGMRHVTAEEITAAGGDLSAIYQ